MLKEQTLDGVGIQELYNTSGYHFSADIFAEAVIVKNDDPRLDSFVQQFTRKFAELSNMMGTPGILLSSTGIGSQTAIHKKKINA